MITDPKVTKYYNDIAAQYDDSRFNNTYGQFIDHQEKKLIKKWITTSSKKNILDLACGTGRFLEFADYGLDISPKMIQIAKDKFPDKKLYVESATKTHFDNEAFDIIISFHLFMHLDKSIISNIFNEAHRTLKKGGRLIFDIPSKKRRRLSKRKTSDWHGATEFSKQELIELSSSKWKLITYSGILFFPIHRLPKKIRTQITRIDTALCSSFLKEYSSYLVFILEKK